LTSCNRYNQHNLICARANPCTKHQHCSAYHRILGEKQQANQPIFRC